MLMMDLAWLPVDNSSLLPFNSLLYMSPADNVDIGYRGHCLKHARTGNDIRAYQISVPKFYKQRNEEFVSVPETWRTLPFRNKINRLIGLGRHCSLVLIEHMDDSSKVLGGWGWSWEENKLFELALAVVNEQHPDRWQMVAAMIGGKRSAEDVQKQYVILVEDLQVIESGKLDHIFGEPQPLILEDSKQTLGWPGEDNNLLVQVVDSQQSCGRK